jgi:hypothetical protein
VVFAKLYKWLMLAIEVRKQDVTMRRNKKKVLREEREIRLE